MAPTHILHADPLETAASLFVVILGPAVDVVNTRFVTGCIRYREMAEEMRPSSTRSVGLRKPRQTIPASDLITVLERVSAQSETSSQQ
jgi:hypothetical protein